MDFLRVRRLPFMARRNFVTEVHHLLLWGLFAGLVEGTVSAVVVSKTFGGSNFLITVVQATPAFANLVSLYWGAMLIGRRKLRAFLAFGAASIAVTLAIAITPQSQMGGWIFALQICLSRVFMSGVVTARASLWKSNYPKSHRGRITSKLQIVRTLMSLPVIIGGGMLFDYNSSAYRWFYPTVAVLGALGLIVLRRESVRGEKSALMRRELGRGEPLSDPGIIEPFSLVALLSPLHMIRRMREALKHDPRFARYIRAQMCIGAASLLVMPVNTIVLTKVLCLTYTASNFLLDVVPRGITLAMLPIWARMFDQVGVLRFRVVNSFCWCGSLLFCGIGAMLALRSGANATGTIVTASLAVYFVGRIIEGMAQSGGAIAWNIGHLHFAEDDKAELYMGIHVSLTGLRGLTAPFLGTFLYTTVGSSVFILGFALSALGLWAFHRLAKEESKHSHTSRTEVITPKHAPARKRKKLQLARQKR